MKKTGQLILLMATIFCFNKSFSQNAKMEADAKRKMDSLFNYASDAMDATTNTIDNNKREIVPQMGCSFIPMIKTVPITREFCGADGQIKVNIYCYNFYKEGTSNFSKENLRKSINITNHHSTAKYDKDGLNLADEFYKYALETAKNGTYVNKGEVIFNGRNFVLLFKKSEVFDMKKNFGEFVLIGINDIKKKDIYTITYRIETLYESKFYDNYIKQMNELMNSFQFQ